MPILRFDPIQVVVKTWMLFSFLGEEENFKVQYIEQEYHCKYIYLNSIIFDYFKINQFISIHYKNIIQDKLCDL